VKLIDNNQGGSWVYFDTDGKGNGDKWGTFLTTLDGVKPKGVTWAQLSPPAGKMLTSSSTTGETLTGGAGGDTLVAGEGPDVLTGGAGSDRFVFSDTPSAAIRITDFKAGVDKIDVAALLRDAGYTGSDAFADGYLKLVANPAGGTSVYFDSDGKGSADPGAVISQLDQVAPSGLTSTDWIFT
jgi:Ca2+-binding RTX toxin-like protein